jgi:hypothetical protein
VHAIRQPVHPAGPQLGQERNQRQTYDGEIISLHALEELNTDTFDLVGADDLAQDGAAARKIGFQKRIAEVAHGEGRAVARPPHHLPPLRQYDSCKLPVGLAPQLLELCARPCKVSRLAQQRLPQSQHLVGAYHKVGREACAHSLGLRPGHGVRDSGWSDPWDQIALDGGLVHMRGSNAKRHSRRFQQPAPKRARRRQQKSAVLRFSHCRSGALLPDGPAGAGRGAA